MEETTFMYLTCDLPAPPLYPDEMRENIIPQVPLFGILNKFNGLVEKEYKTYKDSTLKRFEITQLPPFVILYIKVYYYSSKDFDAKNAIFSRPLQYNVCRLSVCRL